MSRTPFARESRFSARTLERYAAAGLPDALLVRAAANGVTEILVYDEIGWFGITAKDFLMAVAEAGGGPLHIRINSPGGDVFEGMAIYNALRAHPAEVTVTVDGVAASAASVIAMAGHTIQMAETSMLMIHNCWGLCIGNRLAMRDMAGTMEKIDAQMAAIYAGKSGKPQAECQAMMDAETWLTAQEALDAKLCDTLTQPVAHDANADAARALPRAGMDALPRPRALATQPRATEDPPAQATQATQEDPGTEKAAAQADETAQRKARIARALQLAEAA